MKSLRLKMIRRVGAEYRSAWLESERGAWGGGQELDHTRPHGMKWGEPWVGFQESELIQLAF